LWHHTQSSSSSSSSCSLLTTWTLVLLTVQSQLPVQQQPEVAPQMLLSLLIQMQKLPQTVLK
jgi:hypothetical protein